MHLICADAVAILAATPPESVDCIVTDPPYRTISGGKGGTDGRPAGMLAKNDGRIFDHNDIEVETWAPLLFRVLKSPGHAWVFCNELNRHRFESAFRASGFRIHGLHVWVKNNTVPNRWGMKNYEPVFLLRKGPARALYTPSLQQAQMVANVPSPKAHPTEKPVELLRSYIAASTRPGETVLDPFMGVGSTGAACRDLGRIFTGVEIDPVYYGAACARLGVMP